MIFHTPLHFKIVHIALGLIRACLLALSASGVRTTVPILVFLKRFYALVPCIRCSMYGVQGSMLVAALLLCAHSGNLYAASVTKESDEQVAIVVEQFDHLLLKARQLQNQGDYEGSLSKLRETNELAKELKNVTGVISTLVQMSDVYLNIGQVDQAKTLGLKSLELAEKLDNQPKLMASVLNNWGTVLTLDRDYEAALKAFNQGLEQAKRAIEPSLAILILVNLSRTAIINSDLQTAEKALNEGVTLITRLPASRRKAILSAALANQLQELLKENDPNLSSSLLEENARTLWKAVQQFTEKSSDTRLQSNASGNIGYLDEMAGHYDRALEATRRALFFAQQGSHPEMIYRWQWQLGRLFKKTGQIDKALTTYQRAVDSLNPIQTKLMTGYRNSPRYFQQNIKPVYFGLAELYIEAAEKTSNPEQQQLQLQKARLTIEQMKAAEIEDFFQDECITALRNKVTSLDNIGKSSAVIYPMPFKERLVVIATLPSGIVQITSSVDQKTLTRTVISFRKHLQDSSHQSFTGTGKKLHNWIIAGLQERLQGESIKTLVIVPDEALSLIPFAALYDGEKFLIENYAIVTTPSLQLTDPQPAPRENFEALLVGLSVERSDGDNHFPPLPNVPEELDTIGKILQGNSEQLLNQAYEKKALTDAIIQNNYRIIHMATHGEFGPDPNQTFLLTYDGKLYLNQFGNLLKLGLFSDKPIELLTLSACNTGVGDVRAAFGLAGIALESGARSAVATLWSVYDEATMFVMTEFYRQFQSRPDLNKAQALQAAQLSLINQPQYRHPAYWSPFLFIGNWL